MKQIKANEQLLPTHHISRYLKPSLFTINPETGDVFFMENAFFPSQKDEETDQALSVNWMEALDENIDIQLSELAKNRGHIYHKNGKGRIANFNVGRLLENLVQLKDSGYDAQIIFTPTQTIPSHASILNIPLPSHAKEHLKRFNTYMSETVLKTFSALPKAL